MTGLQNIKLNKGWLCNTFDTCESGVKFRNRNLQNLIIIYIVSGFTCNNNNNNNNNKKEKQQLNAYCAGTAKQSSTMNVGLWIHMVVQYEPCLHTLFLRTVLRSPLLLFAFYKHPACLAWTIQLSMSMADIPWVTLALQMHTQRLHSQ